MMIGMAAFYYGMLFLLGILTILVWKFIPLEHSYWEYRYLYFVLLFVISVLNHITGAASVIRIFDSIPFL